MCQKGTGLMLMLLLTVSTVGQQLAQKLTNQDIVNMVRLGLSDAIVIEKIQTSQGTDFDTSVKGLANLKAARVSDAIIEVMIDPHRLYAPMSRDATRSMPTDNLPSEVGVYVFEKGRLQEVEPEIVGWQTGGVLKKIVTLGIDKGHTNGTTLRSASPLRLASPVEFVIRAPEGTSATEYQLLRLYKKGNRREFRAITGGVIHASGGAKRNTVFFNPVKIGAYTWRLKVALPRGEYGLLPPGIAAASIASSGKIYSFAIEEGSDNPALSQVYAPNGTTKASTNETRNPSATQAVQDEERIGEMWRSQPETSISPEPYRQGEQASTLSRRGGAWLGASSADSPRIRHNGVSLSGVEPDSPAYKAGLAAGDIILTVDGKYIYTVEELSSEIQKRAPGSTVEIGFMRGKGIYEVSVVLGQLGKL